MDGAALLAAAVRAAVQANAPRRTVQAVAAAVTGVLVRPTAAAGPHSDDLPRVPDAQSPHAGTDDPAQLLEALRAARRAQRQKKKARRVAAKRAAADATAPRDAPAAEADMGASDGGAAGQCTGPRGSPAAEPAQAPPGPAGDPPAPAGPAPAQLQLHHVGAGNDAGSEISRHTLGPGDLASEVSGTLRAASRTTSAGMARHEPYPNTALGKGGKSGGKGKS